MTCQAPTEAVQTTKGSCLDFTLEYVDESEVAEDISTDTFTITDYYPAALADTVLTKTVPLEGKLGFHLEDNFAANLVLGLSNRFRISRVTAAGHTENSEIIWIEVR